MVVFKLFRLILLPCAVYSAATHETRPKRSTGEGYVKNYYTTPASAPLQYQTPGFGHPGQDSYYSKFEYVDPQYWQRYENFLAGQAVFGQNLGVKGPRVDYHDSYNNGKDKHHLDLI